MSDASSNYGDDDASYISDSDTIDNAPDALLAALAAAGDIEQCAQLMSSEVHTFNLARSRLGRGGVATLTYALLRAASSHTGEASRLLALNLADAGVSGVEAAALVRASAPSFSLTLNLADNALGSDGVAAVAAALGCENGVHSLDLSGNEIGDAGAVILADALTHNSTLRSLSIFNNNIGTDGALALARALARNSTIHTLDAYYNAIGVDGAVALASVLEANTTLTQVKLFPRPREADERASAWNSIAAACAVRTCE